MKKLALSLVTAVALVLLAPTTSAHATDLDVYVCRVNYNVNSNSRSFELSSGANCTGTMHGTFQQDYATDGVLRDSLLLLLTNAASNGMRVTVTYRTTFIGRLIQSVVVHSN